MSKQMAAGLGAVTVILLAGAAQSAVIEQLSVIPASNVNISQSVTSTVNALQARYRSSGDQRLVTQTFKWNSINSISGVGFLIDPPNAFTNDQAYALDIQRLDSYQSGIVQETVLTMNFTLTANVVAGGTYLYIHLPDTPLTNGTMYGLSLRPTAIDSANVLYITTASGTGTYLEGYSGNQVSVAQIAVGSSYLNSGRDMAFFTTTTAVPEPAFLAPLGISLATMLRSRRRRA